MFANLANMLNNANGKGLDDENITNANRRYVARLEQTLRLLGSVNMNPTWVLVISLWYGNSYPLATVPGYKSLADCKASVAEVENVAKGSAHYPIAFCIKGPPQ